MGRKPLAGPARSALMLCPRLGISLAVRMPARGRLLLAAAVAIAVALSLAANAVAQGPRPTARTCKENENATKPASSNATNLIELQPNKSRPTFDVGLADKSSGKDNITFSPKAGERIGTDVAAEVLDAPRANTHPLHATISAAAHPSKSGERAVVEVCLEGVSPWYAGTYQGTINVYGPRISDFSYALVVTTKWPWWVAILVIGATVIFSALVFFLLPQTPNVTLKRDWRYWLAAFVGVIVGGVLAGLTYWSLYQANDTWGSDPQAQILALVMASFSATVVGYGAVASAQKQIPGAAKK